jgi:hypothetical protein
MSASILGPNGQRMVELGGERAWLTRTKGDIVCSFQWIQVDEIDRDAPVACMTLFPAMRHMDTAAYVIPQRNAYVYANRDGGQSPALMGLAFKAAQHMGFFPDQMTVHRVMDIVLAGLPDLIRMPSEQPGSLNIKRIVHGIEASASVNGKRIHEEVL